MKLIPGFLWANILFFGFNPGLQAQVSGSALSTLNPLWANENGQYFSGVCSPYGMVKLGPDNPRPTYLSGYKPGAGIKGFSHTHLNTHEPEASFGHILVMPQIGEPNFRQAQYDKIEDEKMNPARYTVKLIQKQGSIEATLTANQNAGKHRWKFFPTGVEGKASVVIDPIYCLAKSPQTALKSKQFQVQADGSFSGKSTFSADNQTITIFYSGQLNLKNPVIRYRTDTIRLPAKKIKLDTTAFAFTGQVGSGEEVEMTLCLSFKNESEASESLVRMLTQKFDEVQKKAEMAWEDRLSVIQLSDPAKVSLLTTALFRTMISPTDVSGNHPEDQYGEAHFWDQTHLRDMANSVMPLHNLLFVPHQRRFFNSLIRTGESKNGLPEGWISGYYSKNEGGSNAERILAEGVLKGIITGLDAGKAWKVCVKNAMEASPQPEWYGRSQAYLDQGFDVKNAEFIVRSFQWSASDADLARMARKLEKLNDAQKLEGRSFKVVAAFKPKESWFWPTVLACPHLYDTLAALNGGKPALVKILDSLSQRAEFQKNAQLPLHLARAFIKMGQKEKAESVLEKFRDLAGQEKSIFGEQFDPAAGGMANLILVSSGLLPWPGTDEYTLFKPAFDKMEMTISGGKTLVVKGKGKKVYWNGKELKTPVFRHADLVMGGTLEWK